MISVLIIAVLARRHRWSRKNLEPNFCPGHDLNPEPLNWQFSTLTNIAVNLPVNKMEISGNQTLSDWEFYFRCDCILELDKKIYIIAQHKTYYNKGILNSKKSSKK